MIKRTANVCLTCFTDGATPQAARVFATQTENGKSSISEHFPPAVTGIRVVCQQFRVRQADSTSLCLSLPKNEWQGRTVNGAVEIDVLVQETTNFTRKKCVTTVGDTRTGIPSWLYKPMKKINK